jgi:hypothetical protein
MGAVARIELGMASPSWVTVRAIARALDMLMADLGAETERQMETERQR